MGKQSSEYLWVPGEDAPVIQDHSLAKHEVLGQYLRTYIEVVTANLRIDSFRLTLVDGFAGGGMYRTTSGRLHHGSPLQMVHAMKEAEILADSKRSKQFRLDAEFFFVEHHARNREVLDASIQNDPVAANYRGEGRVHVVPGAFESCVHKIVGQIEGKGRAPRAIFMLDQYGYSKVDFATLRSVMDRLPNAEILLTFATDWLIDYMSDKGGVSPDRLRSMGLIDMAENFDKLIKDKQHRDPRWRRLVQSVLHRDLVAQSGARYFTPFFIVSPHAHREYWFVHLSQHSRARDEMASLHWRLKNRFAHYGRNGLGMLGYDPREDALHSEQVVLDFSEASRNSLIDRLAAEVPARLHQAPSEGVAYWDFFDSICNETPATSDQIKAVLSQLSLVGGVEVRDGKTGKVRGAGVQIKPNDRLEIPSQLRLFLGK